MIKNLLYINVGISICIFVKAVFNLYEIFLAYPFESSRDSPSQDSLSQVSEVSDQTVPVLGRRAAREKTNIITKFSDDSDSDIDVCIHS